MPEWLITVLITIALDIVAYVLMPKPKKEKPAAVQDLDSPTAEAGLLIPWLFGTKLIKGINCLGYWDKSTLEREVKV